MKTYKDIITLNKNNRGCYIIDTVKGCSGGNLHSGKGCYGVCYAKNIADRYGFNFCEFKNRNIKNKTDQLYFFGLKDKTHTNHIIQQIKATDMPFIRIGEMGDPSEDWEHTINVCKEIALAGKPIVIVTKHWKVIPDKLLKVISKLNICINTSISALDNEEQLSRRLVQFYRLKEVCNSILRINSCDFNKNNKVGYEYLLTQKELFTHTKNIDNILRFNLKHQLVVNKIINIEKVRFLKSYVYASIYNKNTYFGHCSNCPEMCGVNI